MEMNNGKWMTKYGHVAESRIESMKIQMVNFKELDRKIFTDLLKNVLDTQIREYNVSELNRIVTSTKSKLQNA